MASIKDVAAAAGVSPTTVSHALNNRGRIAEETRVKVLEAATQLGYQANAHAQQLVTRRSRIIAIQMPDVGDEPGPALPLSAYFLELINGAAAASDRAGYALVVTPSGGKATILNSFSIDGAIVVDPQGGEAVFSTGAPVVTVGVPPSTTHHVLAVDNDHAGAARVVLEHFAGLGYRRPALVADDSRRSYVDDVLSGYRAWVAEHGVADTVVTMGSADKDTADDVVAQLREAQVDAVYASSDDLALALLDAASRAGLAIPGELAVASAVDSRSLTLTSPQISATNLFPYLTGSTAAELLIERLDKGSTVVGTRMIPTGFVARASTAALAV
ncbi:LacI family DNA-binding transcriptional regulator [Mycolicibacterium flavescens]|uniref:LacI family transcriptional regulator n=1 Tax=Mycolicibacterium flavescens TaxID=1776 RepID=A0A1E3RI89_MYCFV|nr:LacI family DNA-binding transcriptional regulator [Mycolicibacterium flavescens]MCV7282167.1 LacI family DNA-binding transcriptional regulator [Mycolicibacterium flavescens]ODQ89570.1 LacI family transcriptional regulator [Mycolicibacterium flavescens]